MKLVTTYDEAIEILKKGGVGVMPTDTVYGLVARAADKAAVARLFKVKQRERKPGTIIAASVEQLVKLGFVEPELRAVEYLWPDSVSLVVTAPEELAYLHQGLESLPVRVPGDELLRSVLEQTGPLQTSSANMPAEPTAEDAVAAWNYFGDSVDFYVDGGNLADRAASTIVRMGDGGIEVLREGAVKIH